MQRQCDEDFEKVFLRNLRRKFSMRSEASFKVAVLQFFQIEQVEREHVYCHTKALTNKTVDQNRNMV